MQTKALQWFVSQGNKFNRLALIMENTVLNERRIRKGEVKSLLTGCVGE